MGKLSNGWTDWHQIWYKSADSSGNRHRLNTIRPSILQGVLGGRKLKSWKAVKQLDRLAPNLVQVCGFVWEWTQAKYNLPLDIPGGILGGFRGSKIQKSVEAVKRLDRLAPNLAHMCRFIWEWIYAKQIALRDTRGHLRALGGQTIKSLEKLSNSWTDWHQIWYTSADSSGNGHRINTICPSIPQWAFWGVLGGHKFKCLGKLSNGSTDWHQIWYMFADSSGNGHSYMQFAPPYHRFMCIIIHLGMDMG